MLFFMLIQSQAEIKEQEMVHLAETQKLQDQIKEAAWIGEPVTDQELNLPRLVR